MTGFQKHLMWFIIILPISLLLPAAGSAQGWEVNLGGDGPVDCSTSYCILEDDNGNFLTVGNSDFTHPDSIYAVKISRFGDVLWTRNYGGGVCYDLTETTDGNYIGVGVSDGANGSFIAKIDPDGDVIFTNLVGFNSSFKAYNVGLLSDNTYVLTGISNIDSAQTLAGVDTLGNLLWQKKFSPAGSRYERTLIDQDTIYIIGKMNDSLTLTKSDRYGNLQWQKSYFKDQYTNSDIELSGDGNLFISGSNSGYGNYGNATILKVDREGNVLNNILDHGAVAGLYYEIGAFDLTADGGFIVTGNKSLGCCYKIRFLLKVNGSGTVEWERDYYDQTFNVNLSHDVLQTLDGGYVMGGQAYSGSNTNYKFNVTKTDGSGFHHTNLISGYLFLDDDSDCTFDTTELGLAGAAVRIEPGPHYTNTDENGYFEVRVDTGTYTVYSAFEHPYLNQSCLLSGNTVSLKNPHEKDSLSLFGYSVAQHCPLLTIDFGTSGLRRCFQNTYHVNYQNTGTDTAFGAYAELQFDSAITPVSSSIPWTVNGHTYQFQLGDIDPRSGGGFTIEVDVSCNAPLSSTACVQAHIYPDSNCAASLLDWDHSMIEVEGVCDGDSLIEFIIKNISLPGVGDMDTSREYRIYEDNVLHLIEPYQLNGGDSLTVQIASNAAAYIIRADQDQHNPLRSYAQTFVENCGNSSYPISVIAQFPQNDEYGALEVDCREIMGSWDSNRKQAQPVGFSSNHYISDDQSITYHIQFQNPGNDTASTVVVVDTLAAYLDPASIMTCAASHPFTFHLSGQGVAHWTFLDINLPDSSTDEIASRGFVQFKVAQDQFNPSNSVILNSAGVYFDYNSPVVTNTTYHTVFDNSCQDYIDIGISSTTDTLVINLPEDSAALLNYGPYDSLCTYIMNPIAPRNGAMDMLGNTTLAYSPFPNYFGIDTVEFIICTQEITGLCDTILVIYQIAPVNDPPVTVKDFIKIYQNHQADYDVCANDYDIEFDQLKMSISDLPQHGQVLKGVNGYIHYQPFQDYVGMDEFSYQLCDDGIPAMCNTAIVSLEIEFSKTTHLSQNSTSDVEEVMVYPNPIHESALIVVNVANESESLRLELIDHLGNIVLSKDPSHSTTFEIQKNNLSPGLYLYRIQSGSGYRYTGKLVIK